MTEQVPAQRRRQRGAVSRRGRWVAFTVMAAGGTVVALLLKLLAGFDWGVLTYGLLPFLGLALFITLYVGRPSPLRRWFAFGALALAGGLAAAFLGLTEGLGLVRVLVFGWLPFALVALGLVVFVRRRVAPHRVVQIVSFLLLNAYVVAYLKNTILYQGFFKYVPQPILNCYGGPLAVFACPIGSAQQMVGMKLVPWLPLGVFIIVGALVGRAACGWLCPLGLWQDLLYKIPFHRRKGTKRWVAFGVVAGIGLAASVALIAFVGVAWWKVLVFGWLPFSLLVLAVAATGKRDIPGRLWLGGFIAAVGLGALVWFKFGVGYGVVTGFFGMMVLGLTGRWFAAALTAVAGALLASFGGGFAIGPLSGVGLGMAVGALGFGLVLLLDCGLKVTLPSTYLKFGVLLLVAGLASYLTVEPWFCKLCPNGTFGAGIPLVLWDPVNALRGLVGWLYWVKIGFLLLVVVAAMGIKRPFCRLVCPIGAIYGLFNKVSLLRLESRPGQCRSCGVCRRVCPMNISVYENANQLECIRCMECVWNCGPDGLRIRA